VLALVVVCSVRRGDVLAFNSVFDVVVSAASHDEVKYLDDLAVTPVNGLHPQTSVITRTANLSGSPRAGAM